MPEETVTISIERYDTLVEAVIDLKNIKNVMNSFNYAGDKVRAVESILEMEHSKYDD